jgi:hypothetical protein
MTAAWADPATRFPVVIDRGLDPNGYYQTSYQFYDSLLRADRPRRGRRPAPEGVQRHLTFYDTADGCGHQRAVPAPWAYLAVTGPTRLPTGGVPAMGLNLESALNPLLTKLSQSAKTAYMAQVSAATDPDPRIAVQHRVA